MSSIRIAVTVSVDEIEGVVEAPSWSGFAIREDFVARFLFIVGLLRDIPMNVAFAQDIRAAPDTFVVENMPASAGMKNFCIELQSMRRSCAVLKSKAQSYSVKPTHPQKQATGKRSMRSESSSNNGRVKYLLTIA